MRRARALGCLVALAGCEVAHAQPRPRRDAGVARRDAGTSRDAGAVVARPPTHGRIDPAALRPVIAAAAGDVQRCYERALARDPTARGELEVRVRVEDDGRASETASRTEDASLQGTARCIEAVLSRVAYPRPAGGAATVVVPYRFAAGE